MTTVRKGDATALPLKDESVHCVVTSPPYNVGIEYDGYDDQIDFIEYDRMAAAASREMYRVLVPGGRAWVNVMQAVPVQVNDAAVGDKPADERFPLGDLWLDALLSAGFHYRDTITWIQDSHDGACAWGSYRMPSAPNLRGCYEIILCVYKGKTWKRSPPAMKGWMEPAPPLSAVTPWTDLVRNVWTMRPERRSPGAPAPFPLELPTRCLRLSTWPGETVLDPFAGSGTTVRAARAWDRLGIGFDLGGE